MITPTAIIEVIASYYGVEIRNLRGPRRWTHICRARAVGMYLTRELAHLSYSRVGAWYGGRDHATAIKAVVKVGGWLAVGGEKYDASVVDEVDEIRARLTAAPEAAGP